MNDVYFIFEYINFVFILYNAISIDLKKMTELKSKECCKYSISSVFIIGVLFIWYHDFLLVNVVFKINVGRKKLFFILDKYYAMLTL